MALIRIPVPGAVASGTVYVIEFDSDKIETVQLPREVADGPDGEHRLTGRSSLILRFATLDDAPRWVEAQRRDWAGHSFEEWFADYGGSKWWHGETGYTEEDLRAAWGGAVAAGGDQ